MGKLLLRRSLRVLLGKLGLIAQVLNHGVLLKVWAVLGVAAGRSVLTLCAFALALVLRSSLLHQLRQPLLHLLLHLLVHIIVVLLRLQYFWIEAQELLAILGDHYSAATLHDLEARLVEHGFLISFLHNSVPASAFCDDALQLLLGSELLLILFHRLLLRIGAFGLEVYLWSPVVAVVVAWRLGWVLQVLDGVVLAREGIHLVVWHCQAIRVDPIILNPSRRCEEVVVAVGWEVLAEFDLARLRWGFLLVWIVLGIYDRQEEVH